MDDTKASDNETDKSTKSSSYLLQDDKTSTNKTKTRAKKRKRESSESSMDDVLPENTLEVEKNLKAAAVKNNLDDASVKKILKKVVTNDHVLALVKLREEEEDSGTEDSKLTPKLTRSKVKELMKVSPKSKETWNLENMELTPIKHIPVKTRPEVTALIAQELQDDEDDDEYQPTNDDVPSDDDHTDISCSDVDSQPRTPASSVSASPLLIKDGPFVVPQDIKTPVRRKLDVEEDATIARRTRSKLSLSATSIEHIESSFVPPDEVVPLVDDLWNQFLEECLNPASTSRHEEDDETDPEYSVAADPDANEEDEALESSIIKISKKELNDLVTELFHIMPEDLDKHVENNNTEFVNSGNFNGVWKQEPASEEDKVESKQIEERRKSLASVGKCEPLDDDDPLMIDESRSGAASEVYEPGLVGEAGNTNNSSSVGIHLKERKSVERRSSSVSIHLEEGESVKPPDCLHTLKVPPLLEQNFQKAARTTIVLELAGKDTVLVLPEQRTILQQQLRQHIQLASSTYLHLYIHPKYWNLAHLYKEYLETLNKMVEKNAQSVANVCNLKPAVELTRSWESSVSENTPENRAFVEYLQNDITKAKRAMAQNRSYVGDFHETYKQVVANSSVFLYPHLLPPIPFRVDNVRRSPYCRWEDELLAIGLDQFWQYIEDNPDLYQPNKYNHPVNPRQRWGYTSCMELVVKHMFPWSSPRHLANHIGRLKRSNDTTNPVIRFLNNREITPVKHTLLPYNPEMTLYQQPLNEMPTLWVRYIAKTCQKAKAFLCRDKAKRSKVQPTPAGSAIEIGTPIKEVKKTPLPNDFTKKLYRKDKRARIAPKTENINIQVTPLLSNAFSTTSNSTNLFSFVQTSAGAFLVPMMIQSKTTTVNSVSQPITTPAILVKENNNENDTIQDVGNNVAEQESDAENIEYLPHCKCCKLYRKILKVRQRTITEYIRPRTSKDDVKCPCNSVKSPNITNRLRLLVKRFQNEQSTVMKDLDERLLLLERKVKLLDHIECDNAEDMGIVVSYQLELLSALQSSRNSVIQLLKTFKADSDNPILLAKRIFSACSGDLFELHKGFLAFLTSEQAEELGSFKDYFVRNCVTGLLKRIDAKISDDELKLKLVQKLRDIPNSGQESCDICCDLLDLVRTHRTLAHYMFSLFPHKRKMRKEPTVQHNDPAATITPQTSVKAAMRLALPDEISTIVDTKNVEKLQNDQTTVDDEHAAIPKKEPTAQQNIPTATITPQTSVKPIIRLRLPDEISKIVDTENVEKSQNGQTTVDDEPAALPKSQTPEPRPQTPEPKERLMSECSKLEDTADGDQTQQDYEADRSSESQTPEPRPQTPEPKERLMSECSKLEDTADGDQTQQDYEADRSSDGDDEDNPDDPPTPVRKVTCQISPYISLLPSNEAVGAIRTITVCAEDKSSDNTAVNNIKDVSPSISLFPSTTAVEAPTSTPDGSIENTAVSNIKEVSPYISLFPATTVVDSPRATPFVTLHAIDESSENIAEVDIKDEIIDTPELTISKTAVQDFDSTSDMSMMIMSEDEVIKTEPTEWKKDEDKIILEVLKECLNFEKNKELTNVLEILEETDALHLLAESLLHRSMHEIRERLWVLLDLITLSEK